MTVENTCIALKSNKQPRMLVLILLALTGCQSLGPPSTSPQPTSTVTNLASFDPWSMLVGEFDDNEQVWRAQTQTSGSKTVASKEITPLRVYQRVRVLEHKNEGSGLLLWQLEVLGAAPPLTAAWLYRVQLDNAGVSLVPYRATDPAAISARLGDSAKHFEVQPNEWAALDACALHGTMQAGHIIASVDQAACNALLPTLGASATLLPVRMDADADMLRVATFADQARSSTAMQEARRLRWFSGWAAINGAGSHATMESKDWHEHRNLRIHDEGGRLVVLWRDGSRSGYSFELEHLTYAGSQTRVLKLALIEDASGRIFSYVWANPGATSIGMHLGWVQVGLELQTSTGVTP